MLNLALQMRRSIDSDSLQVADSLHELGVLSLRRHDYAAAEEFLLKSLALKTASAPIYRSNCETNEAATYHQLASVAIAKKKYDQAETLLEKALVIESSQATGNSAVARAAVMQVNLFFF
jgi:Tfp pilus assembly protein PilF